MIGQKFGHGEDKNTAAQLVSHAILGATLAYINGGDPTAGGSAAVASEAAANYLTNQLAEKYKDDPKYFVNGEFQANLLSETEKAQIRDLTAGIGAVIGGAAGDSSYNAQLAGVIGQNAVENNKTSYKQSISNSLFCWNDVCAAQYKNMDVVQEAAFRKGQNQAVSKFVNDIKNLPNVPQEVYEAVKNDPKGTAKAIYEGLKEIPGDILDTGKTIVKGNMVGDTPAEFEALGKAEMTTALNVISAAISAGTVTVVKKGGTVTIEAAKNVKRVLQNDPAKLPPVKASTSGNISAKQISENEKIIDPPKEVLNKQQQLLNNTDNNKSGILREEIADSYFKNSGYTKLESKCGSNCFDGVYLKNGEIYIVEVKPLKERGSVKLSDNKKSVNDIGVQMSDKWIISRAEALVKTKNPDAIKTAGFITKAINQGKPINKIVVGVNDSRAITLNLGNKVTK